MSDAPEQEREQEQEQEQERRLRQLMDRTLRELPYRSAPGTLQARVLGELQRRAAQPWWRRSFAHWPLAARTALIVICIGCTGLALLGGQWTAATLGAMHPGDGIALFQAQQAIGLLSVATALAAVPLRLISPQWLYSGLAAGALLYAILFGLGTVAYRTLYLRPHDGR